MVATAIFGFKHTPCRTLPPYIRQQPNSLWFNDCGFVRFITKLHNSTQHNEMPYNTENKIKHNVIIILDTKINQKMCFVQNVFVISIIEVCGYNVIQFDTQYVRTSK